jgi:hypothetical protein
MLTEQLKDFYDTNKVKATKQMIELIEFYEANDGYLRFSDNFRFVPDRGYYFHSITIQDTGVHAVFTLQGWEHDSTYNLNLDGGFAKEMTKMKEHIEYIKQSWVEEEAKELLTRKEQLEQLKKEFE